MPKFDHFRSLCSKFSAGNLEMLFSVKIEVAAKFSIFVLHLKVFGKRAFLLQGSRSKPGNAH